MGIDFQKADADCRHAFLIEPIQGMEGAYREFLQEFVQSGEEGLLYNLPEAMEDTAGFIRRLKSHTEGFDDASVSCSAYWLLSEEEVLLGEIHIRQRLTLQLENYGGHVGYMVRPSQRRMGYATKMLALGLEKARAIGLHRIMVSCEPENIASARVIEKNGGKLIVEPGVREGRPASRYWIDLQ